MMRQDRFTEQAQQVLAQSQEIVRQKRNSQWAVTHVLAALTGPVVPANWRGGDLALTAERGDESLAWFRGWRFIEPGLFSGPFKIAGIIA